MHSTLRGISLTLKEVAGDPHLFSQVIARFKFPWQLRENNSKRVTIRIWSEDPGFVQGSQSVFVWSRLKLVKSPEFTLYGDRFATIPIRFGHQVDIHHIGKAGPFQFYGINSADVVNEAIVSVGLVATDPERIVLHPAQDAVIKGCLQASDLLIKTVTALARFRFLSRNRPGIPSLLWVRLIWIGRFLWGTQEFIRLQPLAIGIVLNLEDIGIG